MTARDELSVVTDNLHGYNQGSPYLHDLLISNDVVCVQEHWLSSTDEVNSIILIMNLL